MSSLTTSRDGSRERSESRVIKHSNSQSLSESGRSSVPMWDSSDPDRAPPPLPLNPSVGSPVTRANASARIEEAAALIQARARENAPSTYTSNPPPGSASPEKSPTRAQHRRMQTLQGNVSPSKLSDSLERRSYDRGLRSSKLLDFDEFRAGRSERRSVVSDAGSPTPSSRNLKQSENARPGTNMLALQPLPNKQDSTPPLASITNSSIGNSTSPASGTPTMSSIPTVPTMDSLASQILNITSIATSLQREMANLSRRSKDNASDLMDLRKATNSRDEDIRKSLRDLVAGLEKRSEPQHRLLAAPETARSVSSLNSYLEDGGSETPRKTFTISRITSPAFEREISASPSLAYADGAASIALLEKVLREMATKEGQESIRETLEAVRCQVLSQSRAAAASAPNGKDMVTVNPVMVAKLDEILDYMHQLQGEAAAKAVVRRPASGSDRDISQADLFHDRELNGALSSNRDTQAPSFVGASELPTDEFLKLLKNVKQAVTQGGGLTNEVKALVRELRGEVLGMGREIAKKLEDAHSAARPAEDVEQPLGRDEVAAIVGNALGELKEHMYHTVQKVQLQTPVPSQPDIDTAAIVQAVTSAIAQMPAPQNESTRDFAQDREDLIRAVREAWEDCKPEIALEHFGLEREEILETLREGLRSHQPSQPTAETAGATYEEVLDAVRKGLADFQPPSPITEKRDTVTRDEVLTAVREVFETFEWPAMSTIGTESELGAMTRGDISEIVQEAMSTHTPSQSQPQTVPHLSTKAIADAVEEGMARQPPVTKEVEFNREDLFDAIKSCLEGEQNPLGGMGERVVEAMHEFLGSMKTEFKEYSTANGKDTEQVLDALKDGLEDLRADIESYVDRASGVPGKGELLDLVKDGFAGLRMDMDNLASRQSAPASNTTELLDAMEKEFQHLRDSISKSLSMSQPRSGNEEILDALRDLQDERQSSLSSNSGDIARLVKEELAHMRATLAGTLVQSGATIQREDVTDAVREAMETSRNIPKPGGGESILSNTSELLDAFQDGVEHIRADLQKLMNSPADVSTTYEVLDTLKAGIVDVRNDISRLQKSFKENAQSTAADRAVVVRDDENENKIHTELESLKVMITQLRIKIEALDNAPPPVADFPREMRLHKDELEDLHAAIQGVHSTIDGVNSAVQGFHSSLDGVHSSLEEVHSSLDGVHSTVEGVHSTVRDVQNAGPPDVSLPSNLASKEDTDAIETLLTNMKAKIDRMTDPNAAESRSNADQLEAMEHMLREVRVAVDDLGEKSVDGGKADFEFLEFMLKDVQKAVEDIQGRVASISPEGELLSKSEIGVVEGLCADIKARIDDLRIPDPANLPTKDDVNQVKDSLKAFREQIEADNDLTAQAFEARKIEHGGLANKIDDVKGVLGELRDELLNKLDGSEEGIVEINKVLGMHHDGMSAYATAASIAELSAIVKAEFQKQNESNTSRKGQLEEHSATLFNKHDEVSAELKAALEDKFNELMIKYDDAQAANASKLRGLDENATSHVEAMETTREAVDEMKLVVETLGSTVTEACEGISADSKTVFTKVDEASSKLDELHTITALEHEQTREEVVKTGAATSRLEGILAENHPALLAAIREVLDAIIEHRAHSQEQTENLARATEEIKTGLGALPSSITGLLPGPTAAVQESARGVPVGPAYDDSEVHDKLDNLLNLATKAKGADVNDLGVHDKLDNLLEHATKTREVFAEVETHQKNAQQSLSSLDKLDQIHGSVIAAAAEISSLVGTHSRLASDPRPGTRDEVLEAAVALEKRRAQKESVEADIVRLGEEKNALVESMKALRQEHDELSNQTKSLTRQVAKLEAALSTRQQEMREMNDRAESLERRIVDGLMSQARTARGSKKMPQRKKVTPQERDASMSLKRVPSSASTATTGTARLSSVKDSSVNTTSMSLKKRPSLGATKTASARQSAVDRRILSTSHVMGNRGRETSERQLVLAPAPTASTGLVSLKRSHSVKSIPSSYADSQKPSWNNNNNNNSTKKGQHQVTAEDKENMRDEDDFSDNPGDETSTERRSSVSRTSLGTSYMYTDSLTYDTGTGSSLSTNSARTVSYNSSVGGTLNGGPESIIVEEEEDSQTRPADRAPLTHQDSFKTVVPVTENNDAAAAAPAAPADDHHDAESQTQSHSEVISADEEEAEEVQHTAAANEQDKRKSNHNHHGSDSGLGTESLTAGEEEESRSPRRYDGSLGGPGGAKSQFDMAAAKAKSYFDKAAASA